MEELQCIPARRGTATFLPAGKLIKIINTSGSQVIVTWAFALPKPEQKRKKNNDYNAGAGGEKEAEEELPSPTLSSSKRNAPPQSQPTIPTSKKSKRTTVELPSQQEAEEATRQGLAQGDKKSVEESSKKQKGTTTTTTTTAATWSGYLPRVPSVPSLGFSKNNNSKNKVDTNAAAATANEDEQAKDSKTWSSYFAAGKGFSSYIPQQASDTVTQFAGYHARDHDKTYLQQLQDFSKTPVGAAGMAAITGSGYGSSLYAGYSAWNLKHANEIQTMEFLSLSHSRANSLHLTPRINDTLVTNLREPILTLVEDTSPGLHDTLTAACDPNRFKELGASDWEKHGSCAENLVLALKELNERAGLKGAKGVGADVSVNTVPAALNLFMNVAWEKNGELQFGKPRSKPGDFVKFYAERDVVIVMSSCPQDLTGTNGEEIEDAHFIVGDVEEPAQALRRSAPPTRKKSMPRKISSSQTPTTTGSVKAMRAAEPTSSPDAVKKKATIGSQRESKPRAPEPVRSSTSQAFGKENVRSAPDAGEAAAPRPKKKPVPPSVAAPTNGEATVPKERKKPRKLHVRQQATAAGE